MARLKRIASVTIFALILLGCICRTGDVVQRKSSDYKYTPFFEQKEDFDVLFMGTSHVINGIFPMELWNDYGIVSYNFGGHSNLIPTTYWVMENALDYTNPSLIVIDVLEVSSSSKVCSHPDYLHLSFDSFPVTKNKIKAIYDLCDDSDRVDEKQIIEYEHKWEFIWDFGKYHSRWTEIREEDITNENITLEKGAESRIAVAKPNDYSVLPSTETLGNSNTVGLEYLKKMIESCQEKGIEVLLVNLPYPAGEGRQREANSVYEIAEEYGVDYLNFVAMDSVVNYTTDCYDADSHLNPSGARKVTDYLGRYIREHYDVPDRRNDANYQSWNGDFETYVDYKINKINGQKTLDSELMLLQDDDFSTCVYFKDGTQVLKNEVVRNLIHNLSENDEFPVLSQAEQTGEGYFLVVDHGDDSVMECIGEGQQNWATSFGQVSYSGKGGIPSLYIQDMDANLLHTEGLNVAGDVEEPDVQIFVVNNFTKEIVSATQWDYSSTETITRR